MPIAQIDEVEEGDKSSSAKPVAQSVLAEHVTELVHGSKGLESAQRISKALFDSELGSLSESELSQLQQDGISSSILKNEQLSQLPLNQFLVDLGLAASGKQVKDALSRGAISINGVVVAEKDVMDVSAYFDVDRSYCGRYFFLKVGKKKHHLLELV